jgi:phosphatidylglycerophosphate synthase
MFDRQVLAISKPLVDAVARLVVRRGVSANQISITGFVIGMMAVVLIASGYITWALVPLLINRLLDGLDGAVARAEGPTDRGAFLDITLDFLFYAGLPLAFALHDPARNALPAAVLLAAFIGTGVTFLAFAIMAEKRGEKSSAYPSKAFYYLGGLTEGSETVLCFTLMCLLPSQFWLLAFVYAALCAITTMTRLWEGWKRFG